MEYAVTRSQVVEAVPLTWLCATRYRMVFRKMEGIQSAQCPFCTNGSSHLMQIVDGNWRCECGAGDVVSFVERRESVDEIDAVALLGKLVNETAKRSSQPAGGEIPSISEAAERPDLKNARRRRVPDSTSIDRLPPASHEAEQGVLGCILLKSECVSECVEVLKDGKECFYDLRHGTIFEAMVKLWDERKKVDLVTLQQQLKDAQLLDQVGGLTYLMCLPQQTPSAENLSYYLAILKEKYLLRKTLQTCTGVVARIYDHEGDVDGLMDEIDRDMSKLTGSRVVSAKKTAQQLVATSIARVDEYYNRKGAVGGLETGFIDLDKMTDGLHAGELIVIAGAPSGGKTSLAMNIAEHVVLEQKLPVGVFSLEMTAESLMLRSMCSLAEVNLRNIREGFLAERDLPKLTGAAGKLSRAPIWIDDETGISSMQLRAKARRMVQDHGVKLFVVDYLQLLHAILNGRRMTDRRNEVTECSQQMKMMAKELGVPVIVLSQLTREGYADKETKPGMWMLKESSDLEAAADLIGILYRPASDNEDEDAAHQDAVPMKLAICKQRNGPTGDVDLTFFRSYTRFCDAAKISDEDVPEESRGLPYSDR